MLIDTTIFTQLIAVTQAADIDSVNALKNKLSDDEFMTSDKGKELTELLEYVVAVENKDAGYKVSKSNKHKIYDKR